MNRRRPVPEDLDFRTITRSQLHNFRMKGERGQLPFRRSLQCQQPQFQADSLRRRVASGFASGGHDAMAGDDDREAIGGHHGPHGPRRAWKSGLRRQLSITDRLAIPDPAGNFEDALLKFRPARQVHWNIVKVAPLTQAIPFEPLAQLRVPVAERKFPLTTGFDELFEGGAANFVGRRVSNPYRDQNRFPAEQSEPAEICRENRQTRNIVLRISAEIRTTCTLTHLDHPFTMEM